MTAPKKNSEHATNAAKSLPMKDVKNADAVKGGMLNIDGSILPVVTPKQGKTTKDHSEV